MYGYQIGRFNIDVYEEENFDNGVGYHLTIMSEFDDNEKEIERRSLYVSGEYEDITAHFKSMPEIAIAELFYKTRNNGRVEVEKHVETYYTHALVY